jgi:hypothetical protein
MKKFLCLLLIACLSVNGAETKEVLADIQWGLQLNKKSFDELRKLRDASINKQDLIKLYKNRKKLNDAKYESLIVEACAAGLIKLGDSATYKRSLRNKILDPVSFEHSLKMACQKCLGKKKIKQNCTECKGEKSCPNSRCTGNSCVVCRGTGVCPQCFGRGEEWKSCRSCGAQGVIKTNESVFKLYQHKLNQAIAQSKQLIIKNSLKELDRTFLKSIVMIEGDKGVGTGFICDFLGDTVVISNAHVLCGNKKVKLQSNKYGELRYSGVMINKSADMVYYKLESTVDKADALVMSQRIDKFENTENLVVFGNSAGQGVITTLRGKVDEVTAKEIEIDVNIVSGNSGSPVINYETGKVIGIATRGMKQSIDLENMDLRFGDTRRFATRFDLYDETDFFELNEEEYLENLKLYTGAEQAYEKIFSSIRNQGRRYRLNKDHYDIAKEHKISCEVMPLWIKEFTDAKALVSFFDEYIDYYDKAESEE